MLHTTLTLGYTAWIIPVLVLLAVIFQSNLLSCCEGQSNLNTFDQGTLNAAIHMFKGLGGGGRLASWPGQVNWIVGSNLPCWRGTIIVILSIYFKDWSILELAVADLNFDAGFRQCSICIYLYRCTWVRKQTCVLFPTRLWQFLQSST